MSVDRQKATSAQKELIKGLFCSNDKKLPLHFMLTCAACGQLDALNDMIDYSYNMYKANKFTVDQICDIITKKDVQLDHEYYKEIRHKMVTHCLLDTLLYPLDVSFIKYLWNFASFINKKAVDLSNKQQKLKFARYRGSLKEEIIMETVRFDQQTGLIAKLNSCYNEFEYHVTYTNPKNLEYGMNIYKKLINKFPILQFVTPFCRYLAHKYGSILLEQTEMIPLWKHAGHTRYHICTRKQEFRKIIDELYDRYATYTNDDDDDELIMTWKDFQNYVRSCGCSPSSSSEERIRRLINFHKPFNQMDTNFFRRESFFLFYFKAVCDRPEHVKDDIVFQGLGYKLCQPKEDFNFGAQKNELIIYESDSSENISSGDDDKDNDNDDRKDVNVDNKFEVENAKKMYEMRCKFVNDLSDIFLSRELILINYMIKESDMKDKFSKMNNDIANIIVKMLHPLNLNETNYQHSILDEKLRSHWKYTFGVENGKDFFDFEFDLLCQPYFKNIMMDYIKQSNQDSQTVDKKIQEMTDNKMNVVQFREQCQNLMMLS